MVIIETICTIKNYMKQVVEILNVNAWTASATLVIALKKILADVTIKDL